MVSCASSTANRVSFEFRPLLCAKNEASEKEAVPGLSFPSLEFSLFFCVRLYETLNKAKHFLVEIRHLFIFFL